MHKGSGGLSCAEKEEIVSMHNRLRQRVATGAVRGQPLARNMRQMVKLHCCHLSIGAVPVLFLQVWDEELAAVAQRWADQCDRGHDKSRNVGSFDTFFFHSSKS